MDNDVEEGKIIWFIPDIGDNLEAGPAIDSDGNIYLLTRAGLHSYTSEGELRWIQPAPSGDGSGASLSPNNQVVYAPGVTGIFAFDAKTGDILWQRTDFDEDQFYTVATVSADGAKLYIGAGDGDNFPSQNFYAINTIDGTTAWIYESLDTGIRGGYLGGAILDENGHLYVTSQNGQVISLVDQGDVYLEKWTFDLGTEARQAATLTQDGFILQSSNSGFIHKIHRETGAEILFNDWPALGNVGEVFTSVIFSSDGNTIYINAEDQALYAVDYKQGHVKWAYQFEAWGSDPLVRADGVILLMCQIEDAGRVCAIQDNGDSPTLLWYSTEIISTIPLNETNVNISPNGTIFVHMGDQEPLNLYALQGNGMGLSKSSPWAKNLGTIQMNGNP